MEFLVRTLPQDVVRHVFTFWDWPGELRRFKNELDAYNYRGAVGRPSALFLLQIEDSAIKRPLGVVNPRFKHRIHRNLDFQWYQGEYGIIELGYIICNCDQIQNS